MPEMSIKDTIEFLREQGFIYSGRKRKIELNKYMEEKGVKPVRINLTFRKIE